MYLFINIYLHILFIFVILYIMPKQSLAIKKLPPETVRALEMFGAHLAVSRLRRKESLSDRAYRIGVSIPTLRRMEIGDPTVSMGVYATALWLIGKDGELAKIASPEKDDRANENEIQKAIQLGKSRAIAAERSRISRLRSNDDVQS
jgi:hypothetical protein